MEPSEEDAEEAHSFMEMFKRQHSDLFERLAWDGEHSVVALHRASVSEELEEKYSEIFEMHPCAEVEPKDAMKYARDLIKAEKNIYTARPIVVREALIRATNKRVDFIDHTIAGSPMLVEHDGTGEFKEELRPGFFRVHLASINTAQVEL